MINTIVLNLIISFEYILVIFIYFNLPIMLKIV